MKFLSTTIFVLLAGVLSAQITPIDTLSQEYRKELAQVYRDRVRKKQVEFEKISDAKIRKEVESGYRELTTDFLKNIEKGVFVESADYRNLLDGILQKISMANPQYPEIVDTKIVLSWGTSPNAYAIGNGMVVVYVPLVKAIRNEYDLAYIISHEIAHNLLEHSYSGLLEYATTRHSSELKKQTRDIERTKYNKAQMASGLYRDIVYGKRKNNRKFEHQADSLGFVLYRNAFKGKESQALACLEYLNDIDAERDSLTAGDYEKLFSFENLKFRREWIESDELSGYRYDRRPKFWQVDSLKTHPDCTLRAQAIKTHFKVQSAAALEPSPEFAKLKVRSKYDHIIGLYALQEYGQSLYETLLLVKSDPENQFLRQMIYQNLLKLQASQKNYALNKHLDMSNPGFSQSYNTYLHFIRQLRKGELNAIIEHYKI